MCSKVSRNLVQIMTSSRLKRGDVLMTVEAVELELGGRGVGLRAGSGDGLIGQVADDGGTEAMATEEAVTRGDEEMAEVEDETDDGAAEDMVVDEEAEWGTEAAASTLASMFDGGIVEAVADFCGGFAGMEVE